jgi:hypothetical protein
LIERLESELTLRNDHLALRDRRIEELESIQRRDESRMLQMQTDMDAQFENMFNDRRDAEAILEVFIMIS